MPTRASTSLPPDEEPRLTPAGARLLSAAGELFYYRGIRAVGVDLIAERAGTTKKTLYDCFGSKDALVAVYLHTRALRWRRFLLDWLDAHAPAPGRERLLNVFDAVATWHADQQRGCAFVNAFAEVGGTDHPAVPVIRADKEWMSDLFESLAQEAGLPAPEEVATTLHLLYEGALVTAAAGGRKGALSEARAAAARVLAAQD